MSVVRVLKYRAHHGINTYYCMVVRKDPFLYNAHAGNVGGGYKAQEAASGMNK
jgi:hypothetical protein